MKFCLGTVQFGLNYGIQGNGQPQKEKVFEMLSYAIDNGIEMLDTASAYGEAEKVLGDYFRAYPDMAEKVSVVSKLKPDAFSEDNVNDWPEVAEKNARESLERLGIRHFAAYLFHNAASIFDERAVTALSRVKDAGIADRIGVSIYNPEEAMKALDYPQVGAIQIPYNLFDQRLDKCGFFRRAKEQDVLVFARSSLLQGLVMMNPDNLPDRVRFAKDYLERFLSACAEYKTLPLSAAIGYVGCKEGIDYVVFGVDNLRQLEEYVALKDFVLPSEMMQTLENEFENVEERLVNPVLWK